ncbi:Lrp/AsnC family transcriptional regulator [Paenibacillus sp. FSL K6-1096]|uniref:Lrp/AsnC family transcriptional regulator n=1 Tax=Paenibacillus sp. FSL K6-1096 TaxID=2921460 RepID=UPI0030EEEC9D
MPLTKRRLQLLGQLVELYQRTSLPIHYETLARSLGVSKWTAYDMLKEIEKLGFVTRSYEVNSKDTGRSQVVFAPTVKASDLFKQNLSDSLNPADWEQTVAHIRNLLQSVKNGNVNDLIQRMMNEIPSKSSSIEFCGYILGLLLVYVKKLGGRTEMLIRLVVSKTPKRENGMLMFVGTVLGTVIQAINDELGDEFTELVSEFLRIMDQLSSQDQQRLLDLLHEALA